MKLLSHHPVWMARTWRLLVLASAASLAACSTMQATDTGFLENRSTLTRSPDGSSASFRAPTPIDPHQVRALSVAWALPMDDTVSATQRAQLLATLEAAIAKETDALPQRADGRPVTIRAVITRIEAVSPVLNVLTAVFLTVPLDRGGAAVEIQVLDAETQQPLASMAHAYFVPVSEFKARFSALAPAELALQAAATELARLLRDKS